MDEYYINVRIRRNETMDWVLLVHPKGGRTIEKIVCHDDIVSFTLSDILDIAEIGVLAKREQTIPGEVMDKCDHIIGTRDEYDLERKEEVKILKEKGVYCNDLETKFVFCPICGERLIDA